MTGLSVVIAAHDEERVLGRCLDALLPQGEPEVVVVANGCADRTAEMARERGVKVIELPAPGKVAALRAGDAACAAFPRLYLDADVVLAPGSVAAMLACLAGTGLSACAPEPELDLAGVSRVAAGFHRAHERLMAGRRGLAGTGAYLLTEAGHARVWPMPDVLSDDGWAHRSFAPAERATAGRSLVRPARTVAAVVRRRARVRQGNRQLDRLGRTETRLGGADLVTLVRRREVAVCDAACFVAVLVAERLAGPRAGGGWASDRSSRE
ncbi:glycosyltransferase family A protein [Nonomuraea sp. B10E15]|uniref:glycosyltransferase n=1 Tax=Nonomuraea sp. B10E15 TaxID=3153560 RepID=UPI00325C5A8B